MRPQIILFLKISKINTPLAGLTKKKERRFKLLKLGMKEGHYY